MRILRHMAGDMLAMIRRLWPLALVALFAEWGYAIMNTAALPIYLREPRAKGGLGAPADLIGLIISTFLLTETVSKTFFGWAGDRHGRKQFIVGGLFVSAVTPLLLRMATQTWVFFPLRALDGIGGAALWPSVFASVVTLTSNAERSGAMSIFNMVYLFGVALAIPSYSWVIRLTGHHSDVFYIISGVFFVSAILALLCITQTRDPAHAAVPISRHPSETEISEPLGWRQALRLAYRSRILMAIMLASVFQAIGTNLLNGVISIYAIEVLHIPKENMGMIFVGPAIAIVLLALPLGWLGGRWGKVKSVWVGLGTATVAMFAIPYARNWVALTVIAVPLVIGFLVATPAWLALVTQIAPTGRQGLIIGAVATAQGFGAMLGPALGGWLYERVNTGAPFTVAGVLLGLALFIAIREFHEDMRIELSSVPGNGDDPAA